MSATGGGSGRRPGGAFRRFVAPVARYAGQAMFVALGFPVGVFWFVVLLTLASFGSSLLAVLVGFPILALAALVWTLAARLERWRVRLLLGVRIPSPYRRPPPGASRLLRLRTRLLDPALWRDLAYVLLLFPVGIVQLVVVLVAFWIPWQAIAYPLWFEPPGDGADPRTVIPVGGSFGVSGSDAAEEVSESYIQIGRRVMDAPAEILLTVLLGLALAVVGFFLVRLSARAHAALAVALLGPIP